eukprot:241402_1
MGATGLLAGLGGGDHLQGVGQQVAQLQGLNQVGVPDGALIINNHVVEVLVALSDDIVTLLHQLLRPEDRGVEGHGLLHTLTEAGGGDVTLVVEDLIQVGNGLHTRILGEVGLGASLLGQVEDHGVGARLTEDDDIEQGVGSQAVGTVDGGAGGLTSSQEAGHDGVLVAVTGVDDLTGPQGRDTTHGVVDSGHNGDGLLGDIDTSEGLGGLGDTGQLGGELGGLDVVELQVDVVTLGAATTAGEDLTGDGTADDITAGQLHGLGGVALHEALTLLVDEVATLTAGTLSDEDTGAVDAGGVELDELHIRVGQASTADHGATITGASLGGGGGEEAAAEATGGQDGVLGAETVDGTVIDAHGHQTVADTVHDDQIQRVVLVEEVDTVLEGLTVKGVEHGVTGTITGAAGAAGELA